LRTDAAVHVLGLVLAPIGGVLLLLDASSRGGLGAFASIAIYVVCALLMVACSAAYNMRRHCRHRPLLRRIDQAAIFAMIAGTYTPFTVLGLTGYWSWGLTTIVWSLALLGIAAKLCNWSWPERLWIPLYLAISWLVVVAVDPLSETLPEGTLTLLIVGGVIYSAGVVFHLWERLRFSTAVWHGFVLVGAGTHYVAISTIA
jgi:hemolysin III